MCHHVHVTLSAEDKKDVKRLSGVMIPVYASVVLVAVAVVTLTVSHPQTELVASTSIPATR
jgi:hypothetical protein